MNIIGARLRDLRVRHHLSQAGIAKLCGKNQSTIGKTESGKTAPSVQLLLWYADYFGVSLDYLCGRTDKPQEAYECKSQAQSNCLFPEVRDFIEMCFDPNSPYSGKLKKSILEMVEDTQS